MVAGVTSNPHVWLGLCVLFSCVAGLLCILLCCCFQVTEQIYCIFANIFKNIFV